MTARAEPATTDRRLRRAALEAYRDVARTRRGDAAPAVEASFHPYAGLRSTIRLRDGRIAIRLSDMLEDVDDEVVGALLRILVARLLRRRVRPEWLATYSAYASQLSVVRASERLRRQRGRKRVAPPRGQRFDLETIFDQLNHRFFDGRLVRPRLGWTLRDAWRVHGHYDAAHETIVLSRTLDRAETPRFVVEYVLFHEMLHLANPSEVRDGRHRYHTAAFRVAEQRFPRIEEATAWLENFSRTEGTRRRRRRSKPRG